MANRTTISMHGKFLKEAVSKEHPYLKSEDLPSYRRFYVDKSLLKKIRTNSNHLIVGRRGTGKTHLLGAFREFVNEESDTELAIGVSIMEATQSQDSPLPETDKRTSFANKKAASLVFDGFLRVLAKKIEAAINHKYAENSGKRFFPGLAKAKIKRDCDALIIELLKEVDFGSATSDTSNVKTVSVIDKQKHSRSTKGRILAATGSLGPSAKLDAAIGGGASTDQCSETKTDSEIHLSTNLYQVRHIILEILELLKYDTLYILIDEWMELDKRTPSGIQPLFAQYLKTTFFNERRFSVKIASVWHQTTLYDKDHLERSKGVQLHHDIECAVDLDTSFFSTENDVYTFFQKLLFKRLEYACNALETFKNGDDIDSQFIDEIFDSSENFKYLILASHGIPRDFMALFGMCAHKIKGDFSTKCISKDVISKAVVHNYNTIKRKMIDPASLAQKLLVEINAYMESTGRRYFFVKNQSALESTSLKKLVDEELLHQIPSAVTPRTIRDQYKAYYIDLGNYVDWVKSTGVDIAQTEKLSIIPQFSDNIHNNISHYEIMPIYEDKGKVICPNAFCGYVFDSIHPVYKKASICPRCACDIYKA